MSGRVSFRLISYDLKKGAIIGTVSDDGNQVVVSPDGLRVMYQRTLSEQDSELWVSDIDGGNPVKLASVDQLVTGEWSPDGSQVSFSKNRPNGSAALVVGVDGRGLRQFAELESPVVWMVWPAKDVLYLSTFAGGYGPWLSRADGSSPEQVVEGCCVVQDYDPGGKYLFGARWVGEGAGLYAVSLSDRRCLSLKPGVETLFVRAGRDGKSILYLVPGRSEMIVYRHPFRDGKLIGEAEVAARLPFTFPLEDYGTAYDFSRDLSHLVYSEIHGQSNIYRLRR